MADERIGIQISLNGAENAIRTLNEIAKLRDSLNKTAVQINATPWTTNDGIQLSRSASLLYNKTKKDHNDLIKENERFAKEQEKRNAQFRRLDNSLFEEQRRQKEQEKHLLQEQTQQRIDALHAQEEAYKQSVKNGAEYVRSFFGTLESAFSSTSQFSQSIGDAFSGMAGMFQTNFVDRVEKYLTYMFTRTMVGNISAAFERADILNTFTDYMAIAGVSEDLANSSLSRIDQSIRGLPIGLDEAAQRFRRYQMFMGDTRAATNLTIGLQKALIAGGASDSMRSNAYMQIDRLLTTGKLSTSRQWLSLLNGLGVSVRFLAQELGITATNASEFVAQVLDGTITTEDFLGALERLGEGTSDAAIGLDKAIQIYKGTYESWIQNIQFAARRGMANLINSFSEMLDDSTGVPLINYMERFRNAIDNTYKSISAYVTGSPVQTGGLIESISALAGSAGGIDVRGTADSILNYFSKTLDLFKTALDGVDKGSLAEFVGFATTIAGPLGKLFKVIGSGLPVAVGVFERFKDFDFNMLMNDIITQGKALAGTIEAILNVLPDGAMSKIIAFGLVWGRPLAATMRVLGSSIGFLYRQFAGGTTISYVFGSIANFASAIAPAAGVIGTVAFSVGSLLNMIRSYEKEVKDNQENAKSVFGLDDIEAFVNTSERYREEIDRTIESGRENVEKTEHNTERVRSLITQLNEALLSHNRIAAEGIIREINSIMPDWALSLDSVTGDLDENSKAVLHNANALLEHARKQAYAEHMREVLEKKVDAEWNVEKLRKSRGNTQAALDEMDAMYNEWKYNHSMQYPWFDQYLKEEKNYPVDYNYQANRDTLEESLASQSEELKAAQAALNDLNSEYKWAEEGYNSITESVHKAAESVDEAKLAKEEFDEKVSEAMETFEGTAEGAFGGFDEFILGDYKEENRAFNSGDVERWVNERAAALSEYADSVKKLAPLVEQYKDDLDVLTGMKELLQAGPDELIVALSGQNFENIARKAGENAATAQGIDLGLAEASVNIEDHINEITGNVEDGKDSVKDSTESIAQSFYGLSNSVLHASDDTTVILQRSTESWISSLANLTNSWLNVKAVIDANPIIPRVVNPSVPQYYGGYGNGMPESMRNSAAGGLIYAAGGKLISFAPIGTDTVPAMLTPGEYVMRRAATNAYGKRFMDRLNSLDIGGAFKELMHYRPGAVTSGFFSDNSRSYDNHATVNQTIINNSQDYSQRVASRWLRSLR